MASGYHITQRRYGVISFLTERSIGHCCFKEQKKVRNKETTILTVRLDHVIAIHSNQVVESNSNPVVLYGRLSSYHLSFLPIEVKFDYKIKNKNKATHHTVWQFQGNQSTTGVSL